MPTDTQTAPAGPNWRRRVLIGVGLLVAGLGGAVVARLSIPTTPDESNDPPVVRVTPSTAAAKPNVRDSDPVIGVTANGRHRAYLLADLFRPERHVLNDLFGDVPVTVTFCDLDNCVRAYTHTSRGQPLEMKNGGPHPTKARRMVLEVGGRKFEHDTGKPIDGDTQNPFPYQEVTAVRTTWGEWRADHPDTELRADHRLYPPAEKK